jgi:hypothetical protein
MQRPRLLLPRLAKWGTRDLMTDLLFEFTEWLRSTFLVDLSLWISDTALSTWIVTNFWTIPIIQVVHILAIAGSFASVLMIALRVFGLAGHATLAETSQRYTKVLWWSLALLVLSGLLLIIGEPVRELINPIFWIKMVLVVVGILAAVWFAGSMRRQLTTGDVVGGGVKATATFLVLLWCAIMFAGRWIAYAPV